MLKLHTFETVGRGDMLNEVGDELQSVFGKRDTLFEFIQYADICVNLIVDTRHVFIAAVRCCCHLVSET